MIQTPDNLICPVCHGKMYLSQSEEAYEHNYDAYENDPDALVYFFKCMRCGREYEVLDPPKDEREGEYRDYWM